MTTVEMSNEYDVLYNNITSGQAPGLNEYEKSVFLTKAQNMLVSEQFNERTDAVGGGFDGSQKRQYDFSSLIRTESLFPVNSYNDRIKDSEKLDRRSIVYLFPQDYFLAVNELLYDDKYQYVVTPLNYAEYQRLMVKPYNFPVKRGAWRIITGRKNCNVFTAIADTNLVSEDKDAEPEYRFVSSWASGSRTLKITINRGEVSEHPAIQITENGLVASNVSLPQGTTTFAMIDYSSGWNSDNSVYEISLTVVCKIKGEEPKDDEEMFEQLKYFFSLFKKFAVGDKNFAKVVDRLDGLQMISAPSKYTTYTMTGKSIETHIASVPVVEIIGKFNTNPPAYQLRYVKAPTPIILDDLSNYGEDASIDGYKEVSGCQLPAECHHDIVERAVTLAKIAWQGGTVTQARQAAQNNNR